MKASTLSFKTATSLAIVGILMGIAMAASGNHAVMPAHAHLNLLGWVSMFLFGIYYRLHPAIDASRVARIQVAVWTVGTVVLTMAVALIHLGYEAAGPVAGVSSLVVLGGMGLFALLVFRPDSSGDAAGVSLVPAG
jgi:hypothetical protein